MQPIRILFLLLFCFSILNVSGQDSLKTNQTPINKSKLRNAIITESVLYLGSMSYLQFVWYKDQKRVPFHLYNDSKGYLQIDKMGHAYGAYMESYFCYKWLSEIS